MKLKKTEQQPAAAVFKFDFNTVESVTNQRLLNA